MGGAKHIFSDRQRHCDFQHNAYSLTSQERLCLHLMAHRCVVETRPTAPTAILLTKQPIVSFIQAGSSFKWVSAAEKVTDVPIFTCPQVTSLNRRQRAETSVGYEAA